MQCKIWSAKIGSKAVAPPSRTREEIECDRGQNHLLAENKTNPFPRLCHALAVSHGVPSDFLIGKTRKRKPKDVSASKA